MNTFLKVLAVAILTAPAVFSQQPNTPLASLRINGVDGPPYPILGLPVPVGEIVTIQLQGASGSPFLVAQTSGLRASGLPVPGGLLDLDYPNEPLQIVLDGFSGSSGGFVIGIFGTYQLSLLVPPGAPLNTGPALQGAVQSPISSTGITLTAATDVVFMPAPTVIGVSLLDDNCVYQETQATFGFSIPFYGSTWTGCYVCANGFVSFGAPSTDFTPTNAKMHSQVPRIAMFWSDLDCGDPQAGPVTIEVDQIDPANPVVTFKYVHIPDWSAAPLPLLGFHTFGARVHVSSGDVEIHNFPENQNGNYDILVGISAGNNLDPTGPGSMDLSAAMSMPSPYMGQPMEGLYEGFEGVTSITGAFPPGHWYDLSGIYWRYFAFGSGTTGAGYSMARFFPADPSDP